MAQEARKKKSKLRDEDAHQYHTQPTTGRQLSLGACVNSECQSGGARHLLGHHEGTASL